MQLIAPMDRNVYYSLDDMYVAAELLGENFAGDKDVLGLITKDRKNSIYDEGTIFALCEGWPDSDELEQIYQRAREGIRTFHYDTLFQLICRKSSNDAIIDALKTFISKNGIPKLNIRPIIRRLKADDNLTDLLFNILQNNPTPSEKSSFPKLISNARGISAELREWLIKEAERQLSGVETHEIGMDLFTGEVRSVVHSLMDVIDQPSWIVQSSPEITKNHTKGYQ